MAWSPDSLWLATGNNQGEFLLWQTDGSYQTSLPDPALVANARYQNLVGLVQSLSWSPNNDALMAAFNVGIESDNSTVRLWEIAKK